MPSLGDADAILTPDEANARQESGGRTWQLPSFLRGHRILLWVVGLVVVLVSLPLLQSIALKQNEMDALRALRLLGRSLQGSAVYAAEGPVGIGQSPSAPAPAIPGSFQLSALVADDTDLGRRLPDTQLTPDGQLMIHHGYLFELVPTESGQIGVRAWPQAHGETGLGVFLWDGTGQILGHPNQEATWSGPENAPAWPATGSELEAPWRPVQLAPTRITSGS